MRDFTARSEIAMATMLSHRVPNYLQIVDDLTIEPHRVVVKFTDTASQQDKQAVLDQIEWIKKEFGC